MYDDVSFARVVSGNDGLDMNIEVPANIVRAHPGQVYPAQAKVDINMVYSGLLIGPDGEPVGGRILETGDTAHPERPVLDIGQDRVAQDHRRPAGATSATCPTEAATAATAASNRTKDSSR